MNDEDNPNTPAMVEPPAPVIIRYKFQAEELIAGKLVMSDVDPTFRKNVATIRYVFPTVFVIAAIAAYWTLDVVISIICAGSAVYFLINAARLTKKAMAARIKREIEQGHHKNLDTLNELSVTADGLVSRTTHTDSRISWNRIVRIIQTRDCLLIYVQHQFAIIVPRLCIESGNFDEFLAAIETHMPIQRVKAGSTFEAERQGASKTRNRERRSRAVRAFVAGLFTAFLLNQVAFQLTEELFPSLAEPFLYLLTIGVLPVAIGIAAAVWSATELTQRDFETRCRKCQYVLKGLVEPRCPECGERI